MEKKVFPFSVLKPTHNDAFSCIPRFHHLDVLILNGFSILSSMYSVLPSPFPFADFELSDKQTLLRSLC